MNVNKVFLLGNLTRDRELRALASGGSIATFGLATNRTVKKDGKKVDVPEYHTSSCSVRGTNGPGKNSDGDDGGSFLALCRYEGRPHASSA
jgi:hypothetical protein